jgi:hypothetical protein
MAGFLLFEGGEYAFWASCGIGSFVAVESTSEVTMSIGAFQNRFRTVMEMRTTLLGITPEKVTVEIVTRATVNGTMTDSTNQREILAHPERDPEEQVISAKNDDEGKGSATVVKRSFSDLFAGIPPREGNEIVEIGGHALPCHWVENEATLQDQEIQMKFWCSDRIPGGIARSESRFRALAENVHPAENVTILTVTAFEKR